MHYPFSLLEKKTFLQQYKEYSFFVRYPGVKYCHFVVCHINTS